MSFASPRFQHKPAGNRCPECGPLMDSEILPPPMRLGKAYRSLADGLEFDV